MKSGAHTRQTYIVRQIVAIAPNVRPAKYPDATNLEKPTKYDDIMKVLKNASEGRLKGILG